MRFFFISQIILFIFLMPGCSSDSSDKDLDSLKSNNISVRQNAIYRLGEAQKEAGVPMLIHLLKTEHSKALKLDIIDTLVAINANSSVPGLVTTLDTKDNDIVISTIDALGKIGSPDAIPALIKLLDREDRSIQLPAIRALGHFNDSKVIAALTELINNRDQYIRYNAVQALKKIGKSE